MLDSRCPDWSPSAEEDDRDEDLTAVQTPISPTATLALDINNPADLEAQLLRLKDLQSRRKSSTSCFSPPPQKQTPQPPSPPPNPSRKTWSSYLRYEVQCTTYLTIQFLLLSITTGILDAVTFAVYSVFVSKQTGNTVFLALAALENGSVYQTEPNVAVAISLFSIAAILFGHMGNSIGHSKRLWLFISNTLQTSLIFAGAALRYWGSDQQKGPFALGTIALLSVAMGAQVAMAFCVKVPDVNTTMVTGAIVQLATDNAVFAKTNVPRNRRVAFFFAMLLGAFVGSVAASLADPCLGLLVAGILKAFVTVSFLFNGLEK